MNSLASGLKIERIATASHSQRFTYEAVQDSSLRGWSSYDHRGPLSVLMYFGPPRGRGRPKRSLKPSNLGRYYRRAFFHSISRCGVVLSQFMKFSNPGKTVKRWHSRSWTSAMITTTCPFTMPCNNIMLTTIYNPRIDNEATPRERSD